MKDLKIKLEWYTSNLLVWVILAISIGLMVVNIVTMANMYSVIETMWLEIQQVKETNISLYQFIEAHKNDFD
jgi:hypothetical protein